MMLEPQIVNRPERWERPFAGEDMSEQCVARILASAHFASMNPDNFSATTPLEGIIRNDCRVRQFKKHQLIVRQGEYLNSAFIVLSGDITLISPPGIDPKAWGQKDNRSPKKPRTVFSWIKKSKHNEVRHAVSASAASVRTQRKEPAITLIPQLDHYIKDAKVKYKVLGEGKIFGESSVLSRNEMQNTVVARSDVEVLEIRWQGLRELRLREPGFKHTIDQLYRKRGLYDHLASLPLFSHLTHEQLQALSQQALFETHGDVEWQHSFKKASEDAQQQQDDSLLSHAEVMIAQEGDYPDGLLLLRHGFAKVSRRTGSKDYTIGHLHMGSTFGLAELYRGWKQNKLQPLDYSLHALGYIDIIRIPSRWLEENIFNDDMKAIIEEELAASKAHNISDAHTSHAPPIAREFSEFLVENRFINGSQTMMIDLERCVRCDDCVSACASAHDNNPRFNRHGKKHGRYMIANACMHCEDPVCMIGCPTGAIHRSKTGIVNINDTTCIGCSTCANNCPYDNIRMVNIRNEDGQLYTDAAGKPLVKATKCDLCIGHSAKPACEQACSHDALVRIDVKDITQLEEWVDR